MQSSIQDSVVLQTVEDEHRADERKSLSNMHEKSAIQDCGSCTQC